MTTDFSSQAYPSSPSVPSALPAGYVTPQGVQASPTPPITSEQAEARRGQFFELLLREVVTAITGVFTAGVDAFTQLVDWGVGLAADIADIVDSVLHLDELYNLLEAIVNQIGEAFQGLVVTPINTVVSAIVDWLSELLGWRRTTDNNQTNLQNFHISQVASQRTANPRWESRIPFADLTYPEVLLNRLQLYGSTGPASTGTAHTHDLLEGDGWATTGFWVVEPTWAHGGMIVTRHTSTYDHVSMMLRKQTGDINNVFIEVFKFNSEGTELTKVFQSEDISSLLTTTIQYVGVDIEPALIGVVGERFVVRVRNSTDTGIDMVIGGLSQPPAGYIEDDSLRWKGSDSLLSTYDDTQIAAAFADTTVVAWGALGTRNPTINDMSYTDDFNRVELGTLWSLRSNTPGQLYILSGQVNNSGLTSGHQNGVFVGRTARDTSIVQANLYHNPFATGAQKMGVLMHCARDLSQMVYLGVGNGTATIYSGSFDFGLTERASASVSGNGLWGLSYDESTDTYTALKNGDPIGLTWVGGSYVAHGEDFRFGGLRIEKSGGNAAGAMDNWTLRDGLP